jgi:acetyltransferase-like isoleucine patch superfamily enzyme
MNRRNNRIPIAEIITIGILPSCLKKMIYKIKGFDIGKNVKFSFGSILKISEGCVIDEFTKFAPFSVIVANNLSIGKRTEIRAGVFIDVNKIQVGNDVIISETAMIRAGHISKESNILIENKVHVFAGALIDVSRSVVLGEECAVGPKCSIFTHGSYKNILKGYPVSYGDVKIGKRVELTYNVFVAPGVKIGDDAIIAYGSYVNKDIPAGVLAAGCPAIIKREKSEFIIEPSLIKKKIIIKDIIKELVSYLEYVGEIDYFVQYDNLYECHVKSKKFNIVIELDNKVTNYQIGTIYVINNQIDVNVAKSIYFFDTENLKCNTNHNNINLIIKRFFSRYGIRFDEI